MDSPPLGSMSDLPLVDGVVDLAALKARHQSPGAPDGAVQLSQADLMLAAHAESQSWTTVRWLSEAAATMEQAEHYQRSVRGLERTIRGSASSVSRKRVEARESALQEKLVLERQAHAALVTAHLFASVAKRLLDNAWSFPVMPDKLAELRTILEADANEDRGEFAIRAFNLIAELRALEPAEQDRR